MSKIAAVVGKLTANMQAIREHASNMQAFLYFLCTFFFLPPLGILFLGLYIILFNVRVTEEGKRLYKLTSGC